MLIIRSPKSVLNQTGDYQIVLTIPSLKRFSEGLRGPWTVAIAAAIAFVMCLGLSVAATDTVVEVDMAASEAVVAELFFNDFSDSPIQQSLAPGQRQTYRFSGVPSLYRLRLDPARTPGAEVSLYRVAYKFQGRTLAQYSPAQLRTWKRHDFVEAPSSDEALKLLVTGVDPQIETDLRVNPGEPSWQTFIRGILSDPNSIVLLVIVSLPLFLIAGSWRLPFVGEALILIVGSLFAHLVVRFLHGSVGTPPSVVRAVGYASYFGYGKSVDFTSVFIFALIVVSVSFAMRYLASSIVGTPEIAISDRVPPSKHAVWMHVAVFLFIALLFQPSLREAVAAFANSNFGSGATWDDGNMLLWFHKIQQGELPLRDFWYPYGGSYLQYGRLPASFFANWLHAVIVIWFLYFGLYCSVGRRIWQTLFMLMLVLAMIQLNIAVGWQRYLLAIDVALVYFAIAESGRISLRQLPFLFIAAYTLFYEPQQLVYAMVGISCLVAFRLPLWHRHVSEWRQSLRESWRYIMSELLVAGLPIGVATCTFLIYLTAAGMMGGFVSFNKSIRAQSEYAALPADVSTWFRALPEAESGFLLLVLLIGIAVHRATRGTRSLDIPSAALLVVGIVGFVCLQKQITRPHMLNQLVVFPVLATGLYMAATWSRRTIAQTVITGLLLGTTAASVYGRGGVGAYTRKLSAAPYLLTENVSFLSERFAEVQKANALRLSPTQFAGFVDEKTLIDTLFNDLHLAPQQNVYALGDEQIFYLLLGRRAPYVVSSYNSSPISEQLGTLQWLEETKPEFVVWDPRRSQFDSVPHVVRLPLTYRYVVEHYAPRAKAGRFEILQRRELSEPDFQYWRQHLGAEIDLRHVPRVANLSDYPPCDMVNRIGCQDVLVLDFPEVRSARKSVLKVLRNGLPFSVTFELTPGIKRYTINLSRLWFWKSDATISAEPDVRPQIEQRGGADEVLY